VTVFQPFPKLARLSRGCTITEKLDGTNAQVYIVDPDSTEGELYEALAQENPLATSSNGLWMYAGSRTRLITPGKDTDNYGFASWVKEHAEELFQLGEGRHFGEWYGRGIQRTYGLAERRFALFDTSRWPADRPRPACVDVVPVLHEGEFDTNIIKLSLLKLKEVGSQAAPGFMNPEGIVVYHSASRASFKKTFDDRHKEAA
jgi:hypothetical protein